MDDFVDILLESGFIEEKVTAMCQLETSLTKTGSIQIVLSARVNEESALCSDASERLATAINDPSSISSRSRFTQVLELLQFASAAAVAAPNAAAVTGNEVDKALDVGINGAIGSPQAVLSCFTVLLVATLTCVFQQDLI